MSCPEILMCARRPLRALSRSVFLGIDWSCWMKVVIQHFGTLMRMPDQLLKESTMCN